MEKATIAIWISLLAVGFSGWQAYVNAERNSREKQREIEDRLPIIIIKASKQPGPERDFALHFQFDNRDHASATIASVALVSPSNYRLHRAAGLQDGAAVPAKDPFPVTGLAMLSVDNLTIPRKGQAEWFCYLVVPDSESLPTGTVAHIDVVVRLNDNAGTTRTVNRSVTLNP